MTYVVTETAIGWNGQQRTRELACFSDRSEAKQFISRLNRRPGREGFYYIYKHREFSVKMRESTGDSW